MIKLQNSVLFNKEFFNSLNKLISLDIDVKYSIKLAKTVRDIRTEGDIVFPIRDKIFKEFNVDQNTGDSSHLSEEQSVEFNNKLTNLVKEEFEISLDEKIPVDSIHGTIAANDLLNLELIIKY